MNILTDQLPRAIRIDGTVYPINSDFRDCLQIILAFEDNDLAWVEKQAVLLNNLYVEQPTNTREAIKKGVKFLNGHLAGGEGSGSGYRLYSFSKDANFVFAAFQQTHGIDLQNTEYLHWWQFMTLFMDIGSDTFFSNLVGLRKRVKSGKASKEEKQVAREMGDLFDVPEVDTRDLAEKELERAFVEQVRAARKRKKVMDAQGL
jgi:hypothetical protein